MERYAAPRTLYAGMSSFHLNNYLRMYRKHAGFTHSDVGRLLGQKSRGSVRRHEDGGLPTLDAAIAYEVIYGKPIKELFKGRYEEIESDVRARAAEVFAAIPADGKRRPGTARLGQIAHPDDPIIVPWEED